ncbi:MAG TPA: methyltransferase domain-containing protein, partial [Planctomycetota bacterium]|nr:methyltransferase domain-containing protein [Planctomycetota bacterium]
MATTATVADARCPICRATPPSPLIRHDVIGPCALFACPTCSVRFLGAWTREVEEDDYWRDHDVGVAIYTAPDVVEELSTKYARALDALAPDLRRDARVLDVGCGIGTFLAVAESRGFVA